MASMQEEQQEEKRKERGHTPYMSNWIAGSLPYLWPAHALLPVVDIGGVLRCQLSLSTDALGVSIDIAYTCLKGRRETVTNDAVPPSTSFLYHRDIITQRWCCGKTRSRNPSMKKTKPSPRES